MLTITPKCRRNQKHVYAIDSNETKHRLIDSFDFLGQLINFHSLYGKKYLFPLAFVKEVVTFLISRAFANSELMRLCHLVAYGNKDENIFNFVKRFCKYYNKIFRDFGHTNHFGNKSNNSKVHMFIVFAVSDSGVIHAHIFLALPINRFNSAAKFVDYFNSYGISCHPAINKEDGTERNKICDVQEAFKWMLYCAKWENQDLFGKGFKPFRMRSGVIPKFENHKRKASDSLPLRSVVKNGCEQGEKSEAKEKASGNGSFHNAFEFVDVCEGMNLDSVFLNFSENDVHLLVRDEVGSEIKLTDGSQKFGINGTESDSVVGNCIGT